MELLHSAPSLTREEGEGVRASPNVPLLLDHIPKDTSNLHLAPGANRSPFGAFNSRCGQEFGVHSATTELNLFLSSLPTCGSVVTGCD